MDTRVLHASASSSVTVNLEREMGGAKDPVSTLPVFCVGLL